jgi:serine acetyltransferase
MNDIPLQPYTLGQAMSLARQDIERRLLLQGLRPGILTYLGAVLHRGGLAVLLFRLLDYAHARGWRIALKLGHEVLYYFGRVEIHSGASIGPGLVLPDIGGIGIPAFCEIGCNCTFVGPALLTIGGIEGVDLNTDRIVMGDNCVIGSNVRILGAVTLGHGTQIRASSVVMTSFPKEGSLLSGIPARRRAVLRLADIQNWSPLRAKSLNVTSPNSGKQLSCANRLLKQ